MEPKIPDLGDVERAASRIRAHVHRTPVMTCRSLDERAGRALFFKCENFQKVGAFKMRGAANAVFSLPVEERARGVVTHSSGNFAQALALAAKRAGVPAHIVMPRTAPEVKRQAVLGYGARVVRCEPNLAAREETAAAVVSETNGTFIHPYDQFEIIAGQGTLALELLDDVPDLDAIVAPVGGGGLMSGIAIAAHGRRPALRLFGAEPAGADDAARSFAAGRLIPQTNPETIADGLLTSLGRLTWPVLSDHLETIVTVTDEEIVDAMRLVFTRAKLVVEPSAAVAVAAVLSKRFRELTGLERVGVVLSGGNVDPERLPFAGRES
jgi:threonine dehydratase/serine racemase